jgi:hypothetical protein
VESTEALFKRPTALGRAQKSMKQGSLELVARDGIEPPTPAFSGLRPTMGPLALTDPSGSQLIGSVERRSRIQFVHTAPSHSREGPLIRLVSEAIPVRIPPVHEQSSDAGCQRFGAMFSKLLPSMHGSVRLSVAHWRLLHRERQNKEPAKQGGLKYVWPHYEISVW